MVWSNGQWLLADSAESTQCRPIAAACKQHIDVECPINAMENWKKNNINLNCWGLRTQPSMTNML